MASTRIFVRGLPPTFTEEDFKKHFASRNAITDARLIPHRRIGYVGYKTAGEAASAVKYFDRSFIRMSKINVEIARPISRQSDRPLSKEEAQDSNKTTSGQGPREIISPSDALSDNGRKRKREGTEVVDDHRLQEFLQVMQPASKTKPWSRHGVLSVEENGPENKPLQDGDLNTISHRKERPPTKLPQNMESLAQSNHIKEGLQNNSKDNSIVSQSSPQASGEINESAQDHAQPTSGSSDLDWLRSRTSRTLGLLGIEEEEENIAAAESDRYSTEARNAKEADATRRIPRAEVEVPAGGPNNEEVTGRSAGSAPHELEERILSTGRLFLRNLSYTTTNDDLRDQFQPFGSLVEVHVSHTSDGTSKGFAYLQYEEPACALEAFRNRDGTIFHGRLLHILPAAEKRDNIRDDFAISKLPLKTQNQIKRRTEAASNTFNWNSMYMNADAVMTSMADRLGLSKSQLLDPTSADAAVRQAHAETHLIQETKAYLVSCGVDLEAFKRREREDGSVLVKNFPYGTGVAELKPLFEEYGSVKRILMPPAGTMAIVEFNEAAAARTAFSGLAYRRFKDSVLFLEKGPKGLFSGGLKDVNSIDDTHITKRAEFSTSETYESAQPADGLATSTVFVRNLSFKTTNARLVEVFKPLDGFLSATVKTKPDPKNTGGTLSMGFGFLEFSTRDQAHAAISAMNNYSLDGHSLVLRASHKVLDAAEDRKAADRAKSGAGKRTKIIIKNLPFEASKKDIRSLFGTYGQLRSVRVPKKFDSSARGFAFADFVTAKEAENAWNALKDTHLLGRRLVLEFAAEEANDAEEEIAKMQQKVGRQMNKVTLQQLTGSGRKKFTVDGGEEAS